MSERDDYPVAIGAILLTVLALSLGDALIKDTGDTLTLWQIFVLRSLLVLPLLAVLARFWPGASLRVRDMGWTSLRTGLLIGAWVLYYLSLPHLPLALAAAALYTLPLFITLFAALFGGERVATAGWMAVLGGFAGVVLILQPSTAAMNLWTLVPVGGAILYALSMVVTRNRCAGEHPLALATALHIGFVLAGLGATALLRGRGDGFLAGIWHPLTTDAAQTLAILSASILIGSIGTAVAYQNAPSSVIGSFDVAYVGFALVWGILFFGTLPDAVEMAGMALIMGAGAVALRAGVAQSPREQI